MGILHIVPDWNSSHSNNRSHRRRSVLGQISRYQVLLRYLHCRTLCIALHLPTDLPSTWRRPWRIHRGHLASRTRNWWHQIECQPLNRGPIRTEDYGHENPTIGRAHHPGPSCHDSKNLHDFLLLHQPRLVVRSRDPIHGIIRRFLVCILAVHLRFLRWICSPSCWRETLHRQTTAGFHYYRCVPCYVDYGHKKIHGRTETLVLG